MCKGFFKKKKNNAGGESTYAFKKIFVAHFDNSVD